MKQTTTNTNLWSRLADAASTVQRRATRGVIKGAAIVAMLAIYAVGSIVSFGASTLGVASLSAVALTSTAQPAQAWRRRRRGYRRRRGRGWWRGGRRRRRRRRGRGVYLYF